MYAGQIVETATTADLFARPSHPYTRGLFASIPRLDAARGRLTPITGQVPSPDRWPAGCRFQPRCPEAMPACAVAPKESPVAVGHAMRCWLAETEGNGERKTGNGE